MKATATPCGASASAGTNAWPTPAKLRPPAAPCLPRSATGGGYQEPILVLVTSCGEDGGNGVLSWRELRTLIHELGHACHNLLCTTHFQHLWGTRCAARMGMEAA